MAPKHTTGGPRAHYPGINKVAPAHAIGGSHRSEYSSAEASDEHGPFRARLFESLSGQGVTGNEMIRHVPIFAYLVTPDTRCA